MEDEIVQYNTKNYVYDSVQMIKDNRKVFDYKNENAKYLSDNERKLNLEFIEGDLKGKQFEINLLIRP